MNTNHSCRLVVAEKHFKLRIANLKFQIFNLQFSMLLFFTLIGSAQAQEQSPCEAVLERAEDQYDLREYDEALKLLQQCPAEQFLEPRQQLRAHKLEALARLQLGAESEAEKAVESLLDLRPNFSPYEQQDPAAFVELVNKIKARRAKKSDKKWYWIGGGLAAGAVVAFLVFRDEGLSRLPEAPDPPR
jgi:tetratricopeptide (TPR) repeat protein